MREQQPVRDRDLSLWQSAVRQTLAQKPGLTTKQKQVIEAGVSQHALAATEGNLVAPFIPPNFQDQMNEAGLGSAATDSEAMFALAKAAAQSGQPPSALTSLIAHYSSLDIAGWLQCVTNYIKYYKLAHGAPKYIGWKDQGNNLNFGVIERKLPSTCRVLMVGDWGTHMKDNAALLCEAMRKFTPSAVIHLGDVYYSGTEEEVAANVNAVFDAAVQATGIARPAFYAIPGNHDYYAGGKGFYNMIGTINASQPAGTAQQAGYFCLRTEDDTWQFLGMDTGYNDRVPGLVTSAPDLPPHEFEWHEDKLKHFGGSTILLSHHQLYSAKEKLNDGSRRYLNESLHKNFKKYFDRVAAWFWGHEHNLILFKDGMGFGEPGQALRKGRLVGCSAYEETVSADPYEIRYSQISFIPNMKELPKSQSLTLGQKFYDHGFAVFDISPEKIDVSYYSYPSWDQDYAMNPIPVVTDAMKLHTETLMPCPPQTV